MRILLTGGTGFLGSILLKSLLTDERITQVTVITRSRDFYPDPRVRLIHLDLTDPLAANVLAECAGRIDQVVHLAGDYNFHHGYAENYLSNAVAMTHIVNWLGSLGTPVPVHYASTYAVNAGLWLPERAEAPTEVLPPRRLPYALSKAHAERFLLAAPCPSICYRLGVLVGESQTGAIQKIDGPYYLLRLLTRLSDSGVSRLLPLLPIPAHKRALLPLIPVDFAARVIHAGLFQDHEPNAIYGVYRGDDVLIEDLVQSILMQLSMTARPVFMTDMAATALKLQQSITGIPDAVFAFANTPDHFDNPAFRAKFPDLIPPRFAEYQSAFYRGFAVFTGRKLP